MPLDPGLHDGTERGSGTCTDQDDTRSAHQLARDQFGYHNLSQEDRDDLNNYHATVEDYGITLRSEVFRCITLADAIADAAHYLDARIVFPTLPKSVFPYWKIELRKYPPYQIHYDQH